MRSIATGCGSLRRFLLLNTAYNIRAIQASLGCSACRHVRHFTSSEHGSQNRITRYTLNNPATQYATRFQSTAQGSEGSVDAVESKQESRGILMDRAIKVLRVIAAPMVKKTVLIGSAKNMYNCCVEGADFDEFAEACELEDTLQSWFCILHLHIWMCLVRLKVEGKDGTYLSKKLVQMMWLDVEERIKNLGAIDSVVTRDSLQTLGGQFYGLTIAYDEGLLGDDTVLATILWRNLFHNKERTDAEQLARLVEYVRKNVQHLDSLTSEQILSNGHITWLPFYEEIEVEINIGEDSKEL